LFIKCFINWDLLFSLIGESVKANLQQREVEKGQRRWRRGRKDEAETEEVL